MTDIDIYGMNDEDFNNNFDSMLSSLDTEQEEEESTETEQTDAEETESEELQENEESLEDEDSEEDEEPEGEEDLEDSEESEDESEDAENEVKEGDEIETPPEYKKLFEPIKAGGREIQIESIDEAISLIQQGVGFSDKMREMREVRRYVQMLKNNDVLNEDKLSYLLDLNAKDPKAIAKLLSESNINPLDINPEEGNEYSNAGKYHVSDQSLNLTEIVEKLETTPEGKELVDDIGYNWDKQSLDIIAKEPQTLTFLGEQKRLGIYGMIKAQMDKERVLGRLNGLSDLDAYKAVGDRLHRAGKFNDLVQNRTATQPNDLRQKVEPKAKKPVKKEYSKKSAALPKGSKSNTNLKVSDVWSLSDEDFDREFAKLK